MSNLIRHYDHYEDFSKIFNEFVDDLKEAPPSETQAARQKILKLCENNVLHSASNLTQVEQLRKRCSKEDSERLETLIDKVSAITSNLSAHKIALSSQEQSEQKSLGELGQDNNLLSNLPKKVRESILSDYHISKEAVHLFHSLSNNRMIDPKNLTLVGCLQCYALAEKYDTMAAVKTIALLKEFFLLNPNAYKMDVPEGVSKKAFERAWSCVIADLSTKDVSRLPKAFTNEMFTTFNQSPPAYTRYSNFHRLLVGGIFSKIGGNIGAYRNIFEEMPPTNFTSLFSKNYYLISTLDEGVSAIENYFIGRGLLHTLRTARKNPKIESGIAGMMNAAIERGMQLITQSNVRDQSILNEDFVGFLAPVEKAGLFILLGHPIQGFSWAAEAAVQGDSKMLSECYRSGTGTPVDMERAVRYDHQSSLMVGTSDIFLLQPVGKALFEDKSTKTFEVLLQDGSVKIDPLIATQMGIIPRDTFKAIDQTVSKTRDLVKDNPLNTIVSRSAPLRMSELDLRKAPMNPKPTAEDFHQLMEIFYGAMPAVSLTSEHCRRLHALAVYLGLDKIADCLKEGTLPNSAPHLYFYFTPEMTALPHLRDDYSSMDCHVLCKEGLPLDAHSMVLNQMMKPSKEASEQGLPAFDLSKHSRGTVERFLEFLYTGKVEAGYQELLELHYLADEIGNIDLMGYCQESLAKEFQKDRRNVPDAILRFFNNVDFSKASTHDMITFLMQQLASWRDLRLLVGEKWEDNARVEDYSKIDQIIIAIGASDLPQNQILRAALALTKIIDNDQVDADISEIHLSYPLAREIKLHCDILRNQPIDYALLLSHQAREGQPLFLRETNLIQFSDQFTPELNFGYLPIFRNSVRVDLPKGLPATIKYAGLYTIMEGWHSDAAAFIDKAYKQHDATAATFLGIIYEQGIGFRQNMEKAIEMYKEAATRNEPVALINLARCYLNGTGVDVNRSYAIECLQKAAKENETAKRMLGDCYRDGIGVPQSDDRAVELYRAARAQGDRYAGERLRELRVDEPDEDQPDLV